MQKIGETTSFEKVGSVRFFRNNRTTQPDEECRQSEANSIGEARIAITQDRHSLFFLFIRLRRLVSAPSSSPSTTTVSPRKESITGQPDNRCVTYQGYFRPILMFATIDQILLDPSLFYSLSFLFSFQKHGFPLPI